MTLPDTLFYLFAALTLGCAFLVVANPFSRNPVTSAMFLVLTIVSLAVQILVYAGAVMVLFLFVIMLLDLKAEERRRFNVFALVLGCASVAGLLAILAKTIHDSDAGAGLQPALSGETRNLGLDLFTKGQFLLPFEVVSLLLLVAMVGVILLSKRELK